MKLSILTTALILSATQPVVAKFCQDKFVDLMINGNSGKSTTIHLTTKFKGSPEQKNDFLYLSYKHHMTVISQPSSQWVLTHNNNMFMSTDKGKSWSKVRSVDTQANHNNSKRDTLENSKSAKNAKCSEENHNGSMHDTVEGDVTIGQSVNADYHFKYWVNRDTNFIVKQTQETEKYSMFVTQIIEETPDMVLPMPE